MENSDQKIDSLIDESLHEHHNFTADNGQEPLRVDKFLMNRIENSTRNKIQQAAKSGSIFVNGKIVKSNYKIKANDKIQILLKYPVYENILLPEKINLHIEYEDDSILIVNKPPKMVVHPGHGNYSGTLINGLIHKFNKLPNYKGHRPGLVHRIDKDTSGLLVVAKSEESMAFLTKQFYKKSILRCYVAILHSLC